MTTLEDQLRTALRSQAHALRVPDRPAPDRDIVTLGRDPGPRWLTAAACFALIVAGVVALGLRGAGDPEPAPPVASVVPDPTVPAPLMNGWVGFVYGDINLVRSGEEARRLEVAGSDTADEACPAWSPDGTRMLFGRLTGSSDIASNDAELVIVPVGADGAIGAPTVITLDGFDVLDGFDPHPCGIWAPDGRWVALGGTGDVWMVDTQTGAIRRLPDLRPSDLEWRPGTDQLAIAGDMGTNRAAPTLSTPVTVYSVSTGELHQLGSVEAAQLTWSPDGSTLAYQGGEDDASDLRLVDADGANERLLIAGTGRANHGIGPVWSPTGDRIAYQRLCCQGAETHEVVLVSVADGTQTVIEPPQTDGPNGPVRWYPYSVTWSPDGTTLLYTAWSKAPGEPGLANGVIAVPADTPTDVVVLTGAIGPVDYYSHRWVPIQMWGRQPGADTVGPLPTVDPSLIDPSLIDPTTSASSTTTSEAAENGQTTLAKGDDVYIYGFGGLSGRTLDIDAQEQDGVVTGEFRVGGVVVAIQCAAARSGNQDHTLGGVVIDNTDGPARLDDVNVEVGDPLALIIREDPTPVGQRVTLYHPSLWYGEQASEHTGSCNELVDSAPRNLDGGFFDNVRSEDNINTD